MRSIQDFGGRIRRWPGSFRARYGTRRGFGQIPKPVVLEADIEKLRARATTAGPQQTLEARPGLRQANGGTLIVCRILLCHALEIRYYPSVLAGRQSPWRNMQAG